MKQEVAKELFKKVLILQTKIFRFTHCRIVTASADLVSLLSELMNTFIRNSVHSASNFAVNLVIVSKARRNIFHPYFVIVVNCPALPHCTDTMCGDGGTCRETDDGYTCICPALKTGRHCESGTQRSHGSLTAMSVTVPF